MLIVAIGVGTGIGINSLIARRLGEKRFDEANSAASHGFILAIFNWLIFLIFTLVFSELFYTTFSDEPDLVGQAMDYSNVSPVSPVSYSSRWSVKKYSSPPEI